MKQNNEYSVIERLSDEDIERFIEDPTPVESFLLAGGDLIDELFDRLLKSDRKIEDMKKFLKAMKRLQCHHKFRIEKLEVQHGFFDLIYCMENRSENSDIVVEFLNVLYNYDLFRSGILTWEYQQLQFIFESCQKERFRLISQQGQPGFISNERAVSILSQNIKSIIYLLTSGVSFDFSLDAFKCMVTQFINHNYVRFNLSVEENETLIRQNARRKNLLQVMYRTMQTFLIYYHKDSGSIAKIVRYFWMSVPDPFLTKEDFEGIVSGLNLQDRGACPSWYANELKLPVDWTRQPRSLRHNSRCAIRRRLAECFQLTNIENLPLPKALHSYLCWSNLEDIY